MEGDDDERTSEFPFREDADCEDVASATDAGVGTWTPSEFAILARRLRESGFAGAKCGFGGRGSYSAVSEVSLGDKFAVTTEPLRFSDGGVGFHPGYRNEDVLASLNEGAGVNTGSAGASPVASTESWNVVGGSELWDFVVGDGGRVEGVEKRPAISLSLSWILSVISSFFVDQ